MGEEEDERKKCDGKREEEDRRKGSEEEKLDRKVGRERDVFFGIVDNMQKPHLGDWCDSISVQVGMVPHCSPWEVSTWKHQ